MMWRTQVLTLYPEMFPGPLGRSLAGKALENGIWSLEVLDIRDFARDKHRTVDDTPAGGGPGMVMRPDVLGRAIDAALAKRPGSPSDSPDAASGRDVKSSPKNGPLVYFSPRGRKLDQQMVRRIAQGPGITLVCGRFEGVDERVLEHYEIEEVSLGDFVLSGGEIAALALLDSVVRLLPGVVGDPETLREESFEGGLLEYPHYTRPQVWEGLNVPEVLISGHHQRIRTWRLAEQERITRERRPDLWAQYNDRVYRDRGMEKSARKSKRSGKTPDRE